MFTEAAELYDAIYFSFKDYAAEAADIARLVNSLSPGAHTILDVACGTGEHARILSADHGYQVDGIDLNDDFLRFARLKNPAGRFVSADMTDFDLGRRYDAVICMFSSIGYVQTLPALERALACFRNHVTVDGIILVEPWFPPGKLTSGHHATRSAEAGGVRVERVSNTEIDGTLSRLRFDYLLQEGGRSRHTSEVHELGLFTEEETMRAFAAAGLEASHQAEGPAGRGLYIARIVPS